jgi:hypothetical protein
MAGHSDPSLDLKEGFVHPVRNLAHDLFKKPHMPPLMDIPRILDRRSKKICEEPETHRVDDAHQ